LLGLLPLAYLAIVCVVALARAATGHPSVATLALTPDDLGSGRVWLLASSAVIVNGIALPQVLALAATLVAALRRLGALFVLIVMVVAHVGATLLAYAVLWAATGDADGAHNRSFDYGTSAVWLGLLGALAVALLEPARHGDRRAQLVVAAACACALVGATLFPLMPAIEHALAFALGAGLAVLRERRLRDGRSARPVASTESGRAATA
jgi:hypothetical protein